MDITNTYRLYAECVSGGAVTEPTGGSWISALCIWQGSTEPLNASWLQRHCDNLGITEPLNSSWLIALANYYGETTPINGTWANAILVGCGAVPTDLIWNLTTTEWQDETTNWATTTPPVASVSNQSFTDVSQPVILGTATPNVNITATLNGVTYNETSDGTGNFSITVVDGLPAAQAPGNDYTLLVTPTDPATGLEGTQVSATITSITTMVTLVFQMIDSYGDAWNGGSIIIRKETSPGVWEDQEYDGNPYYYATQPLFNSDLPENRLYYKNIGTKGQYSMTFNQYEYGVSTGGIAPFPQAPTVWFDTLDIRTITLEPGFNYRTLVWATGQYAEERSYNIKNGATTIATFGPDGTAWTPDNIQTTFTL